MNQLKKCTNERMFFGVCCGLAKYLNLDISFVRLGFVLGAIFTGSALFWMYLLMAIVLPKEK